jgi:hypothetical protein
VKVHTEATIPVLSPVVSIVTGSSFDAVVNFRMKLFVPAVYRYLPSGE